MESMVGLIFDIRRYTNNDGPGVRTTVFLKGCALRCTWCYNPEGRDPAPSKVLRELADENGNRVLQEQVIGKEMTVDELMSEILEEKALMQGSGGGVTFSGGEPLYQHQFLKEVLQKCRHEGIHTAIDTNGYVSPEILEEILPWTDLLLFDLKHWDRKRHLDFTSVSNVSILKNLERVLNYGIRVWIRIPVVPGFNNTRRDMREMVRMLKQMPAGIEQVHLIPFHSNANEKYKLLGYPNNYERSESLTRRSLIPYRRMFRRASFKTFIGG